MLPLPRLMVMLPDCVGSGINGMSDHKNVLFLYNKKAEQQCSADVFYPAYSALNLSRIPRIISYLSGGIPLNGILLVQNM